MTEHHPITDRASWLALRERDITASDLGAILGVDPFRTPFDVWAQKAGLASPPEENDAMRRGRWLEPAVAEALREQRPDLFVRYPIREYLRDPAIRLGGTPDAWGGYREDIVRTDTDEFALVVFEFKVISRDSYNQRWADGPPLGYQLQTLCNAMLMNASKGILAALVLGWQDAELVVHDIPRHAGAELRISDTARRFWQAFDEGHALAAPDYERDAAAIRQVFRPDASKPAPIDLSADNELSFILEVREERKAEIKAAVAECESLDARIIHKLDGATAATLNGWRISHTLTHRDAYQVAAKDYPTLRISRSKEASP